MNTRRDSNNDRLCEFIIDAVIRVGCDFNGGITDGVQLDFTTTDGTAYRWTAILWGGSGIQAHAAAVTPTTQDTESDITAPGFEPDIVFVAHVGNTGGIGTEAIWSFGACVNDGSASQGSFGFHSDHGPTACSVNAYLSEDRCGRQIFDTGAGYGLEISNFDSSGFSMTPRDSDCNDQIHYLAIADSDNTARIGTYTTPTATGNDTLVDHGITPIFRLLMMTGLQSTGSVISSGDAGAFGLSVVTPDDALSQAWADEDGALTSNNQSLPASQAVNFPQDDGSAFFVATATDIDTYNFSTADGTARKWLDIAIGSAVGAVSDYRYRMRAFG